MLQVLVGWKLVPAKHIVAGLDKLIFVVPLDAVFRGFCVASFPSDLHSLLYVGIFMYSEYGSTKSH